MPKDAHVGAAIHGERGGDGWVSRFADRHFPAVALSPAMILFGVLLCYPLGYSLFISFYRWRLTSPDSFRFVGLQNYVTLLTSATSSRFSVWVPFQNTLTYTVATVTLEFALGFAVALLFQRQLTRFGFLRTFVIIPMMISDVVIALMWRLLWDSNSGFINYLMTLLGQAPHPWLADPSTAMLALVLTDLWQNTPFVFLMLTAGLQALPTDVYEAADIDGASPAQGFWYITVPLLLPVIIITLLFRIIFNFRDFTKIYALTAGGPGRSTEVLSVNLYQQMFRNFDAGFASALAWVIVLMTTLIAAVFVRALWRQTFAR
jgi:multiple sugar transport system permease protein